MKSTIHVLIIKGAHGTQNTLEVTKLDNIFCNFMNYCDKYPLKPKIIRQYLDIFVNVLATSNKLPYRSY